MKTNSLRLLTVALVALVASTAQTSLTMKDAQSFAKYYVNASSDHNTALPWSEKQQKARNFMRNAAACSMIANGLISENNSMSRIAVGGAASLVGSLILAITYGEEAPTPNPGNVTVDSIAAKHAAHEARMAHDASGSTPSGTTPTPAKKKSNVAFYLAWGAYLAGQNLPQIIDFGKDVIYRKNIVKAIWDTLCARRDRSEWAAIFIRNFGPLLMHYTPAGQQLSDKLPSLPDWKIEEKTA